MAYTVISTPQGSVTGQTFTDDLFFQEGATGVYTDCIFQGFVYFGCTPNGVGSPIEGSTLMDCTNLSFVSTSSSVGSRTLACKAWLGNTRNLSLEAYSPEAADVAAGRATYPYTVNYSARALLISGESNVLRGRWDLAGTGSNAFITGVGCYRCDFDGLVVEGGTEENFLSECNYLTTYGTVTNVNGNVLTLSANSGWAANIASNPYALPYIWVCFPEIGTYLRVASAVVGSNQITVVADNRFATPSVGDYFSMGKGFVENFGAVESHPNGVGRGGHRGFGYGTNHGICFWGNCYGNDFSGSHVIADDNFTTQAIPAAGFVDLSLLRDGYDYEPGNRLFDMDEVPASIITWYEVHDRSYNIRNKWNNCVFTDARNNKTKAATGLQLCTVHYAPELTATEWRMEVVDDPSGYGVPLGGYGCEVIGGSFDAPVIVNNVYGVTDDVEAPSVVDTTNSAKTPQFYVDGGYEGGAMVNVLDTGGEPMWTQSYENALLQYRFTLGSQSSVTYLGDIPLSFDLGNSVTTVYELLNLTDSGYGSDTTLLTKAVNLSLSNNTGVGSDSVLGGLAKRLGLVLFYASGIGSDSVTMEIISPLSFDLGQSVLNNAINLGQLTMTGSSSETVTLATRLELSLGDEGTGRDFADTIVWFSGKIDLVSTLSGRGEDSYILSRIVPNRWRYTRHVDRTFRKDAAVSAETSAAGSISVEVTNDD